MKLQKALEKLKFTAQHLPYFYAPNFLRNYDAEKHLAELSPEAQQDIYERLPLLNKLTQPFTLSDQATSLAELSLKKHSRYKFDLAKASMGFPRNSKLDITFGDVVNIPDTPTVVKSRAITDNNQNAVLLKLNSPRHYRFYNDPYEFVEKVNKIVFRGQAHTAERKRIIRDFIGEPYTDFESTHRSNESKKYFLSPVQQMEYKFILSLEGVDVASNLKWVMATNSLVVMPKPKVESWFLETRLVAGLHYIEVQDDFSNLQEAIQPYLDNPSLADEMIHAKNAYVQPYFDEKRERVLCHLCLLYTSPSPRDA